MSTCYVPGNALCIVDTKVNESRLHEDEIAVTSQN
jgi:hypothetical protein